MRTNVQEKQKVAETNHNKMKTGLTGFRKIIADQDFKPGFLGLFVNPCYHARKGLSDYINKFAPYFKGIVLDIGCGNKPYENYFKCERYIGLETFARLNDNKSCEDVRYGGVILPFKNKSLDGVIATQVMEHVPEPDNFLEEIRRVLKPGGILLLTVPFVWNEHEQPHDYRRYTSYGIRDVVEKHDFEIIQYDKILPDFRAVAQILNNIIGQLTARVPKVVRALITCTLMAFVNISGGFLKMIIPKFEDFYLDNIIMIRRQQD